jgi:hypothetical protein
MPEIFVIFCLAATGSLVRFSIAFALQFCAKKMRRETMASGPGSSDQPNASADPLVAVGLTLTCYGALALGLILSLPGELAIERTWLAFALLCVGCLVGEISRARATSVDRDPQGERDEPEDVLPSSVGLSMMLMLVLNLAVAVLCSGQGLVGIVPPAPSANQAQATELEPIVVVAGRGSDPLASSSSFL